MSGILFLTDLDHNLFQSKRVNDQGVVPMTVNKDSVAHCYATKAQHALLNLMRKNAFCVAVTARIPEQMKRVSGWETNQTHDLALCDLGLTLLYRKNGGQWEPIPAWSQAFLEQARKVAENVRVDFDQFQVHMESIFGDGMPSGLSYALNNCFECEQTPFYFLAQQSSKTAAKQRDNAQVRAACKLFMDQRPGRYFYHESDTTHALWPTYVSKQIAVTELHTAFKEGLDDPRFEAARAEMGEIDLVLASGDSLSDLPFMQSADFWIAPSASQISNLLAPCVITPFTTDLYES